jgi:dienelactone hydrolase
MGGSVSLDELLDLVDQQWPIDRRQVMLVGHSMGAAQCINWIDRAESAVLAAAIIGGGRPPATPAKWREIQVLAAAGEQDFGRRGVEAFAGALKRQGHPQVQLEIYPAIEHLVIVQAALDDVFAGWDPLLTPPADGSSD